MFCVTKFQIPHPPPFRILFKSLILVLKLLYERHHIAFMFNFEVLNLEVDCKEAEQNLLELFFKLDHDQLTLILLSHLLWRFQSTFKL